MCDSNKNFKTVINILPSLKIIIPDCHICSHKDCHVGPDYVYTVKKINTGKPQSCPCPCHFKEGKTYARGV